MRSHFPAQYDPKAGHAVTGHRLNELAKSQNAVGLGNHGGVGGHAISGFIHAQIPPPETIIGIAEIIEADTEQGEGASTVREFSTANNVNASRDTIDVGSTFIAGDRVRYSNEGNPGDIGLDDGSHYWVGKLTSTTATLHDSKSEATAGTNPYNLNTIAPAERHSLTKEETSKEQACLEDPAPNAGFDAPCIASHFYLCKFHWYEHSTQTWKIHDDPEDRLRLDASLWEMSEDFRRLPQLLKTGQKISAVWDTQRGWLTPLFSPAKTRVFCATTTEFIAANDVGKAVGEEGEGTGEAVLVRLGCAHGGDGLPSGSEVIYVRRPDYQISDFVSASEVAGSDADDRLIIAAECPTVAEVEEAAPDCPGPLILMSPNCGEDQVSQTPTISWTSDGETFDVYFGLPGNLLLVLQDTTAKTFAPGFLQANTQYCWLIIAKKVDCPGIRSEYCCFNTGPDPAVSSSSSTVALSTTSSSCSSTDVGDFSTASTVSTPTSKSTVSTASSYSSLSSTSTASSSTGAADYSSSSSSSPSSYSSKSTASTLSTSVSSQSFSTLSSSSSSPSTLSSTSTDVADFSSSSCSTDSTASSQSLSTASTASTQSSKTESSYSSSSSESSTSSYSTASSYSSLTSLSTASTLSTSQSSYSSLSTASSLSSYSTASTISTSSTQSSRTYSSVSTLTSKSTVSTQSSKSLSSYSSSSSESSTSSYSTASSISSYSTLSSQSSISTSQSSYSSQSPGVADPSPSFGSGDVRTVAGTESISITFSVSAGQTIIVASSAFAISGQPSTSVTDDDGNSYGFVESESNSDNLTVSLRVAVASSSTTIVITMTADRLSSMTLAAITVNNYSNVVNDTNRATGASLTADLGGMNPSGGTSPYLYIAVMSHSTITQGNLPISPNWNEIWTVLVVTKGLPLSMVWEAGTGSMTANWSIGGEIDADWVAVGGTFEHD